MPPRLRRFVAGAAGGAFGKHFQLKPITEPPNVPAMGWGFRHKYRLAAAALGLLGVAFYTLLLPWHLTSQLQAQLFKAEFGDLSAVMCTTGDAPASSIPGAPDTSCPVCKGLAAFHFAVAPATQAALPALTVLAVVYGEARKDLAGTATITPRNRGPPLPA
jgi:hypothetical protein